GRVDRAHPAESRVLKKVLGLAGHGGGKRLEADSPAFTVLSAWVAAGAPLDDAASATLARIEVTPRERAVEVGAARGAQLVVTAVFVDGRREDVTRVARYESRAPDVAAADATGLVTARAPGAAPIVVSFLGSFTDATVLAPRPGGDRAAAHAARRRTLVDDHVLGRLEALRMKPAADADDATFLRRVMLDAIGTLPTPEEQRAFVADRREGKRERLVDAVLARPELADWWATLLSDWTGNDSRYFGEDSWKHGYQWWSWLRARLAQHQPYDAMVRDILTATSRDGRTWEAYLAWMQAEQAKVKDRADWDLDYEHKKTLDLFWTKTVNRAPEAVAQEVSYSFLGVHIDCAQCHKHPFDRWTQDDFWRFAAFFPRVRVGYPAAVRRLYADERPPTKEVFVATADDGIQPLKNPRTGAVVTPRLLGGADVPDGSAADPRVALARWVTSRDNPFFARAIVNRVFAHYFGRGLVEPTDALSAGNPPFDRALLDALTKDFVDHGFDLTRLHRTLLTSTVYGLDARAAEPGQDERLLAHYVVRRLPAEVLLDAVNRVTERDGSIGDVFAPPNVRAIAFPASRPVGAAARPFALFGRPKRAAANDCERDDAPTLPQAVYTTNDAEILDKVRAPGGRLDRLLEAGASDGAILDDLALSALGRALHPDERARLLDRVAAWQAPGEGAPGKPAARRHEALEDAALAILTLPEFQTNH
ncbi:MAG TPA: DUF1549 domain-containing protein, partial [Byssovorax sp.]